MFVCVCVIQPTGWAQRQVETAANFAVGSLFWSIVTAGINVQIEHHLFPSMSSDRLEALVPVVKETCKYVPRYIPGHWEGGVDRQL